MSRAQQAIQEQYDVALDRKNHPVGGKSYTNYLYTQGLDKILKKCGEETFEAVIAAKNDDTAETVGELNDVIYHVTVLLCQQEVSLAAVMDALNVRCAAQGLGVDEIYDIIAQRGASGGDGSYTAYLFGQGLDKILKKVGEACSLLLLAGKAGDREKIAYETADLLYHLLAMMVAKDIPVAALADELDRRSGKTGNLKTFHTTDLNT
ncbi:MAG: phosphoribosyl-ATP diphosphatase [Clostridiales bacterium]|nr:phosphoribosyl-ATP diphosphatase [Clostridiales bacterium]